MRNPKKHSPMYRIKDNLRTDLILVTHSTEYNWQAYTSLSSSDDNAIV